MAKTEQKNTELTKIDLFNAKNSGKKIEKDLEIEVSAVGTFADTDKDGNDVNVTVLKSATDSNVYTTISATIYNSLELLREILADNGTIRVKVIESKSQSGRNFFQLQIIG